MKRIITIIAAILVVSPSCQKIDVWDWEVPENTYEGLLFPSEGVLSINAATDPGMSASLILVADDNVRPMNEIVSAEIRFEWEGMPYKVKADKIRFQADGLPGRVKCIEVRRGEDKASTIVWAGKYSFDTELSRHSEYGWEDRLSSGDRLSGEWMLRFESDDGNRLLFKVSEIQVTHR